MIACGTSEAAAPYPTTYLHSTASDLSATLG